MAKERSKTTWPAKDKLIIALDVETPTKALDLVKQLHSIAGMFKVGSQLFTSAGPQIVRDIIALDSKVFLDLKFHDIPHQVAGAARSAAELGVSLFTIHASGGSEMMRRAVDAVAEVGEKGGTRSAVLAISVLTSMDATSLSQIGITSPPTESVIRLVKLAEVSGVDGVVASPQEIETIRQAVSNPGSWSSPPASDPQTTKPRAKIKNESQHPQQQSPRARVISSWDGQSRERLTQSPPPTQSWRRCSALHKRTELSIKVACKLWSRTLYLPQL